MSKLRLGYSGSSLLSPVFLAFILTLVTPVAVAQSNSVFNGPRDYPVGASPNSVVIGDFNGDGRPDIATANDTSNDVSVLLQNNDGTFQTAVSYPAGSAPILLQAGDVNGDGKLDLLFINLLWPNDTLAVLLSNGDGTFQAPQFTAFPYGSLPYMVLAPQIDIYDIGVLLSNGNGTFQTPVAYPVSGTLVGWGAADVNKDGKLDIVSVGSFSGNGGVSVLLGKGDGTFQAAITSATPGATSRRVVIADFNQDGNLDVVGTAHGVRTYFSVYWGNGDGTFRLEPLSQPELPFLCDSEAFDLPVAVGDVNGDGKPDLFVDCEIFAQDGTEISRSSLLITH